MTADRLLLRAARFVRQRKYAEAIRLLEPEVVRYHDSFGFYYILASACLRSGDFGGALTYLRRAREIRMRDPNVLIGLAILYLRRGDTDKSVELYLEVLERQPANRTARRGLQIVRRRGDPEKLAEWLDSGRLASLYPALPAVQPVWPQLIGISAAAIAAILVAGWAMVAGIIPSPWSTPDPRGFLETAALTAETRSQAVEIGGRYRYVLSRDDVLAKYDRAQVLFREYRDEAAKVELNALLDSNAAGAIKEKARILIGYAAVPAFDTLRDHFTYRHVQDDPWAYRDCHIVWGGLATNLRAGTDSTEFDLLVGYETRDQLEGIVPVRFDFAVAVDIERPLEVLARVAAEEDGSQFRLIGVALHQAKKLDAAMGGANR